MLNCLAAAIPGGERVVSVEEVFELRFTHPDWVRAADPADRARGHRRDPAARPGQGEPADAAEPDHRRRGAGRGVPRPAARAQRRAARHVHASTPTAPARRWSRCARCRCWPARTSRRGSWSRRSRPSVDLVVHLGHRRARRTPGQRDRRRARAGSRTTSSRPSRSSCAAATSCGAPAGCRRGSSRSSGAASTCTAAPRRPAGARLMGALVGLGVGVGLLLVWSAFVAAAAAERPSRAARAGRPSCSPAPGWRGVDHRVRACCAWSCGLVAALRGPGRLADAAGRARLRGDRRLPAGRGRERSRAPAPARARRGLARGGRQPGLRGPRRDVAARRAGRARRPRARSRCGRRSTRSRSTTR